MIQLIKIICARKQRYSNEHLGDDTAKRPHVDRRTVGVAKDYLRRAVIPGLDVRKHFAMIKTRAAKIYHFELSVAFQ